MFSQPLDAHVTEAPSESVSLPCQSSIPVNKTSIPCYFYFNGFCSRGDRCSFLHGPDGIAPNGKSSKSASAVTDALLSENKTSAGDGTGSPPTEIRPNPSEAPLKLAVDVRVQPKGHLLQSAPKRIPERRASPQISLSEGETVAVVKSDSMVAAEGFMKTKSHLYTDWSSDEHADDHVEPEERLESSPGFDVLVDNENRAENLGFEDDSEYLLATNREHRELNGHFLGYDLEGPIEYDPMYPESEPHEGETYNVHYYLDNEHILDKVREYPGRARERILDSMLSRKRKLFPMKVSVDDCNADLRDYLRKRRVVDGHSIVHSTRRHESSRLMGRIQGRHRGLLLHGRLASEFGKNYIESHGHKGTLPNGANQHGWARHSKSNILRQHPKGKRLLKRKSHLSAISRKPFSSERRSSQTETAFTGPKSLAEIKEEKKKAEESGGHFGKVGHLSRTLTDFQGPKPLSEILKEKRRPGTVSDADTWSC